MIYGQLGNLTDDYQRNWTPLLNISKTSNLILRKKWETESEEEVDAEIVSGGLKFDQYKNRLRELTCVGISIHAFSCQLWLTHLSVLRIRFYMDAKFEL